jgi:hypothetical protein
VDALLPLEEPELAAAPGTDAAGIRSFLADDAHVLATLARRRGWKLDPLVRRFTRRFDGRVPRVRLAKPRRRTKRMLTQGHVAQHVLFHTFHGAAVPAHALELFGIPRDGFLAARQAGSTPAGIARALGREPATVRAGVLALLEDEAARGVRSRSQTRAQARRMLARQRAALDCWMATPLPKLDPANPFGGRDGGPGTAPRFGSRAGDPRLWRRRPRARDGRVLRPETEADDVLCRPLPRSAAERHGSASGGSSARSAASLRLSQACGRRRRRHGRVSDSRSHPGDAPRPGPQPCSASSPGASRRRR